MTIWLILAVITVGVFVALAAPLFRRRQGGPPRTSREIAIYRDQLAELQREVEVGRILPVEARQAEAEIQRKILATAEDHPDANELHRRAKEIDATVSLSTVYRTLSALEQQGVVQRHAFESATARFETADAPHHDHLIDIDTGAVIEFRSDKIEQLQAEIAAELGYDLVRHRLELYCRKRKD